MVSGVCNNIKLPTGVTQSNQAEAEVWNKAFKIEFLWVIILKLNLND